MTRLVRLGFTRASRAATTECHLAELNPGLLQSERDGRWALADLLMQRDNLDCLVVARWSANDIEPNLHYLTGSALQGATAAALCFARGAPRPLLLAQSGGQVDINPGWCDDV